MFRPRTLHVVYTSPMSVGWFAVGEWPRRIGPRWSWFLCGECGEVLVLGLSFCLQVGIGVGWEVGLRPRLAAICKALRDARDRLVDGR